MSESRSASVRDAPPSSADDPTPPPSQKSIDSDAVLAASLAKKHTTDGGAPAKFPPRAIVMNDPANTLARNAEANYTDNGVSTTKYTLLTFLPKNLFEQFRRAANFYFLLSAILQVIPQISPQDPITAFIPIIIVLAITAIKEAVEDYRRYQADQVVNNSFAHVIDMGVEVERQWKHLAVGDIVRVDKNEHLPADLVLLYSETPGGIAYIETSNLDGETNLKQKQSVPATQSVFTSPEAIGKLQRASVHCQGPILDLYNFEGKYIDPAGAEHPVGKDQMMLRGSSLRNTPFVYALVVYTGHQTKLMLNAGKPPSKMTKLERAMNQQVLLMFLVEGSICLASAVLSGVYNDKLLAHYYLNLQYSSPVWGIMSFFTFIILYNTMIPLSIYVSLEIAKLAQVLFIWQDVKMYYEENDTPARARTSNLNEELGQIEYIFTDKTGTLTRNIMEFMKCTIGGISYGSGVTEIEVTNAARRGEHLELKPSPTKGYNFEDPMLLRHLHNDHENARLIDDFLTSMAVNHAVIPERDPKDETQIVYNASSPDESALVFAAKQLGYEFLSRSPDTVTIRVDGGGILTYTLLHNIEFTSKRRRSSVIVRTPEGHLKLLCKGADQMIFERLDKAKNSKFLQTTIDHLETYANQGLRTLVFASRDLSQAEYDAWAKDYKQASLSIGGRREELMGEVAERIEQELVVCGASAIEDKLQLGVPQAIEVLEQANIKVWMLTGDKQETAINIGFACSLINAEFTQIKCNAKTEQEARDLLTEKYGEFRQCTLEKDLLGLIVDGGTMGIIFDKDIEDRDREAGKVTLTEMFMGLAEKCRGVICCRMSPKQKALIVQTVKNSRKVKPITLAIGDGANDVPMIQTAHIGVGISGEEGLQAVRASDYSIAQFRFLARLVLVHGRLNYKRNGKLVLYFFYKNLCFTLTQLWFGIYCAFSGQTLEDTWIVALYNIVFTGLPIILMTMADQDVSPETVMQNPKLYMHGQKSKEFTFTLYWLWVVRGFFDSVVCFFVCYLALGAQSDWGIGLFADGHAWSLQQFGALVAYACVTTVTLALAYEQQSWNGLTTFGILSAFIGLFGWSLIEMVIFFAFWYIPMQIFRSGLFWFCVMLSACISMLPAFLVNYVKRNYYPEPFQILQERERGFGAGLDEEKHATTTAATTAATAEATGRVDHEVEMKEVRTAVSPSERARPTE
eukprot:TRINITY_DN4136_c0_g2_i1.p1 TRINITY_DN4136_c0_g2~~TRINITY_DN4136_c0_g2_i1.p1  ORF type:complete len:1193 (-),score=298.49 TRINITY_DN4136_c0_g2_i1:16-3594(-)